MENWRFSFRVPPGLTDGTDRIEVRVHDYAYGTKHKQTQNKTQNTPKTKDRRDTHNRKSNKRENSGSLSRSYYPT